MDLWRTMRPGNEHDFGTLDVECATVKSQLIQLDELTRHPFPVIDLDISRRTFFEMYHHAIDDVSAKICALYDAETCQIHLPVSLQCLTLTLHTPVLWTGAMLLEGEEAVTYSGMCAKDPEMFSNFLSGGGSMCTEIKLRLMLMDDPLMPEVQNAVPSAMATHAALDGAGHVKCCFPSNILRYEHVGLSGMSELEKMQHQITRETGINFGINNLTLFMLYSVADKTAFFPAFCRSTMAKARPALDVKLPPGYGYNDLESEGYCEVFVSRITQGSKCIDDSMLERYQTVVTTLDPVFDSAINDLREHRGVTPPTEFREQSKPEVQLTQIGLTNMVRQYYTGKYVR